MWANSEFLTSCAEEHAAHAALHSNIPTTLRLKTVRGEIPELLWFTLSWAFSLYMETDLSPNNFLEHSLENFSFAYNSVVSKVCLRNIQLMNIPWARGLVGCGLWGCKESDTTMQLTHTHTHTHTCYVLGTGKTNWIPGLMCACMLSCFSRVQLFAILWTMVLQAPLSMGFSRQEYWSGLLCPPSGDLPNPGTEPASLMFPALAGEFFYC